jgi:predicted aspartyl protease
MRISAVGRRAALLGGLASLGAGAAPGEIEIRIDCSNGRCLVPVALDGRVARMRLDTGAELTLVTRAAVARLGLRPDPWVGTTLRGAGGLVERRANVDVGVAQLGGVKLFQRLAGGGLSLPVTNSDLGDADGLLGGDVLRHYVLDLDIPRARLALHRPGMPSHPDGAVPLQSLRGDLLLAQVRLDGRALTGLVDTGASASLINARGLYRLGLAPPLVVHDPAVPMLAVGGESIVHRRRFAELRIGAVTVAGPTILTESVPEPAYDLVLGLDVLGRQRLLLSYPGLTLQFLRG